MARLPTGSAVLVVLLAAHLLLSIGRLPGRVYGRRLDDVDAYRADGPARHLLEGAQLGGADVYEWLLQNTPDDCVVLWRWPADGALEFSSALLWPRLVVDERAVRDGTTHVLGRTIARGAPDGDDVVGQLVIQGTDDAGLRLTTRQR